MRRTALRAVRRALRGVEALLAEDDARPAVSAPRANPDELERFRRALSALNPDSGAGSYLQMHLDRLARTLTLVPPPAPQGRILELGCYMQMTPLLVSELGYREVRGAYLGPVGGQEQRRIRTAAGSQFVCPIDLFDAERDPYPYEDGRFDVVLACEIFEHLAHDPMHLLVESRRVLAPGGALLLTTPNSVSLACVAKALIGVEAPQVFAKYPDPRKQEACGPHVREYAPAELRALIEAAGFEVEWMSTEPIGPPDLHAWAEELLKSSGFDHPLRGEQIYCLARKREDAEVERYPQVVYEST